MPVPGSKAAPTLFSGIPHLHTDYWCIQRRPLNQTISAYKGPKGGTVWNKERTWNVAIVASSQYCARCLWTRHFDALYCFYWCHVEPSWNVMAHGEAREGKWRGNWRMEWIASTLHTTSEHGVSSITTADAHTPAASSRLNWRPRRFKWTRPFRRKTKSGFCACAITFQNAA
jgi:hypothetical protein